MTTIQILDQNTIDKIAAGEVIERPQAVVKELVENAIDAGATAVVVEIKEGGIDFIRITDNGKGIPKAEVPLAFLRHATSKIRTAEDLMGVSSLGFRGEALSSIAAVAQVELITKTAEEESATRYLIDGGTERKLEDIGAPDGTTFIVRNLFFNTPARKKFLKTAKTEAGYVSALMERMALSHPEISFKFINNNQTKLHSSGNTSLKDIIYHIYGREIAANLVEIDQQTEGVHVTGYIGNPTVSRGNRNYENYYINARYVKSSVISRAIEEGYKSFMMQHKYPFTVLHFAIDGELIDVNVHPTKMELRLSNSAALFAMVSETIHRALSARELIPRVTIDAERPKQKEIPPAANFLDLQGVKNAGTAHSPFAPLTPAAPSQLPPASVTAKAAAQAVPETPEEKNLDYFMQEMKKRVADYHEQRLRTNPPQPEVIEEQAALTEAVKEKRESLTEAAKEEAAVPKTVQESAASYGIEAPVAQEEQISLFDEKLLSEKARKNHKLIGQLFGTYWMVEFNEQLFIIDQHAAHEKVLYEQLMHDLKGKEHTSQLLHPPIILTLSMQEEELLNQYMDNFKEVGYEIEPFGGREYAVRAVPGNLYRLGRKDLLIEMLDQLSGELAKGTPELITERLASMSCKAAVKGNHNFSAAEAEALIEKLLELENPYNCPHGRPTIISMTKYELEKKFKRIV